MTTEVMTALPPEVEQYRQLIKSRLRWHTRFVYGYSMPWHQLVWAEALEDFSIKRLLIIAPPKYGKALALDTPIPVPTGWTTMSELKVGDAVFAGDGTVTRVIGVSPVWKDRRVFRVEDKLGHSIIADGAHEWIVRLDRERPTVFTKHETEWLYRRQHGLSEGRAFYVGVHGGLKIPDVPLPIPPYTLGVWLGDGDSDQGRFTCGEDDRNFISSEIRKDGLKVKNRTGLRSTIYGLFRLLRVNGLLLHKRIPAEYLRASPRQRLALLQGLMDTDGYVAKDGDGGEFCSMIQVLAKQVAELVVSLGMKCSLATGNAVCQGKDCGTKYRVLFRGQNVFRLPRKLSRCHKGVRDGHYITIRPAGLADTKCITVDHESHTFLAGDGMFQTCNSPVVGDYLGWRIGREPENYHCIYVSNTARQADKYSVALRDTIAYNKNYRFLYGLEPDVNKGWGENEWFIKRKNEADKDPTLQSTGVGGPILGATVQEVVYDDIADQENMATEYQREKLMDWVKTTPTSRLVPGGREIMVCVAEGSRILGVDGWQAIESIRVGDEVWSVESDELQCRTVTDKWSSGVQPIVRVSTRTKSLCTTVSHWWLVARGNGLKWIPAGELGVGDLVTVVKEIPQVSDGLLPDILCKDGPFCWFFGMMIGDGWVTTRDGQNYDRLRNKSYPRHGTVMCLAAGIRSKMNNVAKKLMERFSGGEVRLTAGGYYRSDKSTLGRLLLSLGLNQGAGNKTIPEWAFRLSIRHRRALLWGLLSADGCKVQGAGVKPTGRYRLSSVSHDLVEGARLLAMTCGVEVGSVLSINRMVKAPHSKDARMCTVYSVSLRMRHYRDGKMRSFYQGNLPDGVVLERVTAVEQVGECKVWDLTVSGAESFIAEGFVAHNCTRWHEKDPAAEFEKEGWVVIRLSAIDEDGNPTYPEYWSIDDLIGDKPSSAKSSLGTKQYELMFQQNVLPEGGNIFKREWWRWAERVEKDGEGLWVVCDA